MTSFQPELPSRSTVGAQLVGHHHVECVALASSADAWALQQAVLAHLAEIWREPDRGIWESRKPERHFTFSKVLRVASVLTA